MVLQMYQNAFRFSKQPTIIILKNKNDLSKTKKTIDKHSKNLQ